MADRQTCNQILLLMLRALGTLVRRAHHLRYKGGPKSPPHIFLVFTNLDCFDLGMSLCEKSYVLSQGSDVFYVDHWPRAIYLSDRQTDRLTDIQTGRQTDMFCCRQTSYHCLSMDCLHTVTVIELS